MHLARYPTIEFFYAWIRISDWFFFIKNVKKSYPSITKVYLIYEKASLYITIVMTVALRVKKK